MNTKEQYLQIAHDIFKINEIFVDYYEAELKLNVEWQLISMYLLLYGKKMPWPSSEEESLSMNGSHIAIRYFYASDAIEDIVEATNVSSERKALFMRAINALGKQISKKFSPQGWDEEDDY